MITRKFIQTSIRNFRANSRKISHPLVKPVLRFSILASAVSIPAYYYKNVLDDHERRLIRVTSGGIIRFLRSAKVGAFTSFDYWWSLRRVKENDIEYLELLKTIHKRSAERILHGCLKNGGLYIKLGQGLANLDHVLPKEYIQTLKVLQDKCLERRKNELFQIFEEEFGKSHKDMFESFDEEPIAAASLAQVFKAKKKDGTEVAVKVQYIDLRDRFKGDMTTIRILLNFAGKIFPKYDFGWVVDELENPLELELDFLAEARNSEKCAQHLSHLKYAYIPKVFWDQSSHRVLTTEFIHGVKISDVDNLAEENYSFVDIDTKLFTIFAEQIFHSGFVHADPHPGNLLVRKRKNGEAEIVILDHGLYETLPENFRRSLCNLWKAVVMNNHLEMRKYSHQLGISDKDYRLFCIALLQKYVPTETNDEEDLIKWFFGFRNLRNLSTEDKNRLRIEAEKLHDRLMEIFQKLPGKLILVCRNLNAIRSIGRIHGGVVDRHSVMAHCATRYLFNEENSNFLKRFYFRILFELKLWYDGVKRFALTYIISWFRFPIPVDFHV